MRMIYRQWPVIAVLLAIIGAAVSMSLSDSGAENGRQRIDLAQVQALLSSSNRTADYRFLPESVMTGLCWRSVGGSREGLFKDVNAGIAHWREQAPSMSAAVGPDGKSAAAIAADRSIDYERLSKRLDRLFFVATGYRYHPPVAEITGVLTIADTSRQVALRVDMSEAKSQYSQEDLIALTASTVINPADFGDALTTVIDQPLRLCIAMQAAKEQVLADP